MVAPRSSSIFSSAPVARPRRARFIAAILASLAVAAWTGHARADAALDPAPVDADRPAKTPRSNGSAPFSIGALAGIGFPRPVSFEVMTKLGGLVGLGVEYGFLPSVSVDGVGASAWALTGDARVFPFHGAFFIGARAGYQSITASASAASLTESAELATWFLNPRIGFMWTFRPGFTIATEAGVQIPLSSSFSTTLPDPVAVAVRDSTVVRTLSGVLPTVDLLRVGFMF